MQTAWTGARDVDGCKQIGSIVFGGKLDQALSCRINQCIKTKSTPAFSQTGADFLLRPAGAAGEGKTLSGFPRRGNFLRQPHQMEGREPPPRGGLRGRAGGVFTDAVNAKRRERFICLFPLITCECKVYKNLKMMLNCCSGAPAYYRMLCKILIIQSKLNLLSNYSHRTTQGVNVLVVKRVK